MYLALVLTPRLSKAMHSINSVTSKTTQLLQHSSASVPRMGSGSITIPIANLGAVSRTFHPQLPRFSPQQRRKIIWWVLDSRAIDISPRVEIATELASVRSLNFRHLEGSGRVKKIVICSTREERGLFQTRYINS